MEPTSIEPLGDSAFLAHFAGEQPARDWATQSEPGSGRASETSSSLTDRWPFSPTRNKSTCSFWNRSFVLLSRRLWLEKPRGRLVIPVLYDGADLDDAAARLNLTTAELIAIHSSVDYDVFAVGFLPGFPYAGYLPPALSGLARRDSPRLQVPAGSVAIAGRQTAIYPRRSPGGWHLIGTTPLCIVDVEAGYFPIGPGDRIRFQPIPAVDFEARLNERL